MRLKRLLVALSLLLLLPLFASFSVSAQTPNPTWNGQYFDNAFLGGDPVFTRTDGDIAFDWGLGSPGSGIPENEFSARWSTDTYFQAGTYRFWILADDNMSVTIDFNRTIINTFETNEVDRLISRDVELSAGTHHIQVDYREVNDVAFAYVDFANLAQNPTGPDFSRPINPPPTGAWTAQYFNNRDLAGSPVLVRGEAQAGGNWGASAPSPSVPADNFSARWTSTLSLNGGEYLLRAYADDGIRVFVDGILVINEWHIASGQEYTVNRTLSNGNHTITVEYFEAGGRAFAEFDITQTSPPVVGNTAVVIVSNLNVRETPTISSGNIIARVSFGQTLPALARTQDNLWIQVNANGVIGWVDARFVSVSNINALPITDGVSQPTGYIVLATPFTVNIRTGPGTQFDDIGNLPVGDIAQVIGRNANATWWQINYNGVIGWSSAEYAILQSGANLSQIPITG
ncbi:MAG: PA14 domain-containing protein [Aggregatilineales bacterium]